MDADDETRLEMAEALFPDEEDCEALFLPESIHLAKDVYRYQRNLQRRSHMVIRPLIESQTAIKRWSATTQQLIDYEGETRHFPGGYHEPGASFTARYYPAQV